MVVTKSKDNPREKKMKLGGEGRLCDDVPRKFGYKFAQNWPVMTFTRPIVLLSHHFLGQEPGEWLMLMNRGGCL